MDYNENDKTINTKYSWTDPCLIAKLNKEIETVKLLKTN